MRGARILHQATLIRQRPSQQQRVHGLRQAAKGVVAQGARRLIPAIQQLHKEQSEDVDQAQEQHHQEEDLEEPYDII